MEGNLSFGIGAEEDQVWPMGGWSIADSVSDCLNLVNKSPPGLHWIGVEIIAYKVYHISYSFILFVPQRNDKWVSHFL